jgi:hypothetical protein
MNIKTIHLVETRRLHGGIQKIYKFPNGYGASVVKHEGSYGYDLDKWEIAPLGSNNEFIGISILGWHDDVQGHLNDPEVDRILKQIADFEVLQDA